MRLKRSGSNRRTGWTSLIQDKEASVTWNEKNESIQLSFRHIDDPNGKGQYDYKMELTLREFTEIIEKISSESINDKNGKISSTLSSSTTSLLRLLLSSSGILLQKNQSTTS